MLKFILRNTKKKHIGFGLEEENIRRLKNKEPILVDMSIFGIDANILIFYERTSDDLLKHIVPYIDKETKIHES